MDVSDLLLTYLQVAAAFAGFAGIVSAIDVGAAKVAPEVISFRFRMLIMVALGMMALCPLPHVLGAFGLGPDAMWRWANAAVVVATPASVGLSLRYNARVKDSEGHLQLSYWTVVTMAGAVTIVSAFAVLGLVSGSGAFVLAMSDYEVTVGVLFLRLVSTLDPGLRKKN
jgi:hypothetical protein